MSKKASDPGLQWSYWAVEILLVPLRHVSFSFNLKTAVCLLLENL